MHKEMYVVWWDWILGSGCRHLTIPLSEIRCVSWFHWPASKSSLLSVQKKANSNHIWMTQQFLEDADTIQKRQYDRKVQTRWIYTHKNKEGNAEFPLCLCYWHSCKHKIKLLHHVTHEAFKSCLEFPFHAAVNMITKADGCKFILSPVLKLLPFFPEHHSKC